VQFHRVREASSLGMHFDFGLRPYGQGAKTAVLRAQLEIPPAHSFQGRLSRETNAEPGPPWHTHRRLGFYILPAVPPGQLLVIVEAPGLSA